MSEGAAPLRSAPPRYGRWLVAGTPTAMRYPCRCKPAGDCSPVWCICAGRPDTEGMPPRCCSRAYSLADIRRAQREYEAAQARKRARLQG